MIQELRRQGLAVIVISHSLPEVFEVADRITVLRLGRTVGTLETSSVDLTQVVGMMTGAWEGSPSSAETDGAEINGY